MKNQDMPAMPQTGTEGASGDLNSSADWGGTGLNKREMFAMHAMQGLLARGYASLKPNMLGEKSLSVEAVQIADALLKELEK